MKLKRPLLCVLWLLAALAWQPAALAQAAAAAPAASEPARSLPPLTQYSAKGADSCLECHDDETVAYSAGAIFKTKHGHQGDKRSPFGAKGLQCEACHGPGAQHSAKGSKKKLSINSFKADSYLSVEVRNQACLGCHEGGTRTGWHAGAHERNAVACTDCHRIHQPQGDPVMTRTTEAAVCLTCHKNQTAAFYTYPDSGECCVGHARLLTGGTPISFNNLMDANAALAVEKNMMVILLMFITVVAIFCVTNTLIVITVQKTNEIGLLKAIGAPGKQIPIDGLRLFEIAGLTERGGEVDGGLDEIRLKDQRLAIGRNRLAQPPKRAQTTAPVVVDTGMVGV